MSGILFSAEGAVARVRLNRPDALHALTRDMCARAAEALLGWRDDPAIELILLDHAAGRGFCAGGDVRAAAASGRTDGTEARAFFADEYRLNHLLHVYPKPTVAFMDGVTMGGGVGVAQPCRWRVATERTVWAMPETALGLFPDVGAGWYLSRLPGRVGPFLALTGARLGPGDCLALGLATHVIASDRLDDVKARLLADPRSVETILAEASGPADAPLSARREDIDRLFAADRLEDILSALAADGSEWAGAQHALLAGRSPTACKVALRELRESALLVDFADEMRMEYGLAAHLCQRNDFLEGVRAILLEKDNAPRWHPDTPEGVTDGLLDTIFAPLPEGEAWTPVSL